MIMFETFKKSIVYESLKKLYVITRTYILRFPGRLFKRSVLINQSYDFEIYNVKDKKHTFFGYYDKTPFSKNNEMILANSTDTDQRTISSNDILEVGYFDNSKNWFFLGETTTWCWQQGCRLQWYGKNDSQTLIFYNTLVNGDYGSVIQNVKTQEIIESHETALYDINYDGHWGLTLNFSRLGRLRPGYGYNNKKDYTEGYLAPDNDGIWTYNFKTKQKKLIICLKKLSTLKTVVSMDGAEHYVNHISFNPSGNRFMFFHLWVIDGQRFSRLLTSDLNGVNIKVLTNEGNVSHYTWKNDSEILVTIKTDRLKYRLYNEETMDYTDFAINHLSTDGHPSYIDALNEKVLTDTYPNKFGFQSLLFYKNKELTKIGEFYSPFRYVKDFRCDLHPRLNLEKNKICFDTTFSGSRKMCVITNK